ncbi:MAG: aldo/keto reductase [Bdellovibrionales bacterium]|nr:aldo/keto reductase [Bdellovibrionales bacterium]
MPKHPSHATPLGTKSYFAGPTQKTSIQGSLLGRTGLSVSSFALGGNLFGQDDTQISVIEKAISSGINLIDTSAIYQDGKSQKAIGEALNRLVRQERIERSQIVLSLKVGYLEGLELALAQNRTPSDHSSPDDILRLSDDFWYSIEPGLIEDQITRSLERLGVECLDFVLLQNPEFILQGDPSHRKFYDKVKRAFAHLEEERESGRIQYFGVSSNGFVLENTHPLFVSLEVLKEIAETVAADLKRPNHGFAMIEFPFNLLEPGAVFEQAHLGKSTVEWAMAQKVGAIAHRPFRAYFNDTPIQLTDFPNHHGDDLEDELMAAMKRALDLEMTYPGKAIVPANRIAWGHILRQNFQQLSQLKAWRIHLAQEILPTFERAIALLHESGGALSNWARDYRPVANALFETFTRYLEQDCAFRARRIAAQIDRACPELLSTPELAKKVLRLCRSFPGIQSQVVGMHKMEYVESVLQSGAPVHPEFATDAIEAVIEALSEELVQDEPESSTNH